MQRQNSEAAAVKARWLGNFCPRQPVHRALKRQQQPRPLSAAQGSSAQAPLGSSSQKLGSTWSTLVLPACSKQHAPARVLRPRFRERPASQVHLPRTRVGLQYPRSLTAATGSTVLNRQAQLGSSSYKLGFIGATQARPACSK